MQISSHQRNMQKNVHCILFASCKLINHCDTAEEKGGKKGDRKWIQNVLSAFVKTNNHTEQLLIVDAPFAYFATFCLPYGNLSNRTGAVETILRFSQFHGYLLYARTFETFLRRNSIDISNGEWNCDSELAEFCSTQTQCKRQFFFSRRFKFWRQIYAWDKIT